MSAEEDASSKKRRRNKRVTSDRVAFEVVPQSSSPAKALNGHTDNIDVYIEPPSRDDIQLSLWVQLEGCDAVPIVVRAGLTVHSLKLLLGGFPNLISPDECRKKAIEVQSSVQKLQFDILGLRGIRPQQLKILHDGKVLSPPSKLNDCLDNNATIQVQILASPIQSSLHPPTSYPSSSSPSTDSETARLIWEMRHELDSLRRRLNGSDISPLSSVPSSSNAIDANGAMIDNTESSHVLNRLEVLEAKLDLKNSQLEAIMKDMKGLTLALRGMAGQPPNVYTDKGPSNMVDGIPNIKCKQTIEGHGGPVWALAKNDQYIFSGSSDTTIQAWDSQSMRPVKTLTGHNSIVHSVEVWNNTIISGSDDRCLKFWDMDQDFKCVKTISANNVACVLRVASNHLFAGLYKTVKVWNLETGEFSRDLDNHNHWVRALNVTKGHLYSGCYNVINMIDLGTFKHMKSMTQNVGSIYSIVVDNNMLYAGTYGNTISVWDLRTFECVRTLSGHTGAVYSLAMSKGQGKLYSGSYDTTIRVWDLNTLSPIQRLVGHTSSVEALLTTDAGLYSASTDGTLRLWR